jgi:4a-hydroxytetrahydrobiopterin dehydratase
MSEMTLDDLLNEHAFEREQGSPTLAPAEVQKMLALVPGWSLTDDGKTIHMMRRNEDFMAAIGLVNKIAALAEEEQHHPDIRVRGYRLLDLDLSTHSAGGLTSNDFIMAAKINRLLESA